MKNKLSIAICIGFLSFSESSISDSGGYTYIATPSGDGPFPAVLYNHGGLGTEVGGDLRATDISFLNTHL